MKLTISSNIIFKIIALGIIGLCAIIFYNRSTASPINDPLSFSQVEMISVFKSEIRIPIIGVETSIESVGLTKNGEMGVPKDISNTAWYNLGTQIGKAGSAVINGHFGWKEGKSSAFDNLYKLKIGDKIYIENRKETIIFVVKEIRVFNKKEGTESVFNSSDGKSHLNLITCNGVWNKEENSYSNRLVVFTDREV